MQFANKDTYIVIEHIRRNGYLFMQLNDETPANALEAITHYCKYSTTSNPLKLKLALNALNKVAWPEVIKFINEATKEYSDKNALPSLS